MTLLWPAAVQEKTRTRPRSTSNLGVIRRRAQSEHNRSLRLHNHHAPEHANCCRWIVDLDFSMVALPTEPLFHGFGGATESEFGKGSGDFRKAITFRKDESKVRNRVLIEAQVPVGNKYVLEGLLDRQRVQMLFVHLQNEARDPVGDDASEQVSFGGDEAIHGLGRDTSALRHASHAGAGIAAGVKLLARRGDD